MAMTSRPPASVPDGRIVVSDISKVFGGKVRAVDRLSFTVEPGSVTGFLGPNGAGKTTTLRMVLGLVRPTAGHATIGGRPYAQIPDPLSAVGAALESASFHPARTARNHLRVLCAAANLPDRRADEVLDQVGLRDAARRKVRGFSMGMRQRLALAAALLGNPRVLILDEPANGLDPEGIRWLRGFFRYLAGEGRTILVSSHQLNEVEEFADRVVILNRGQLVRQGSIAELTAGSHTVVVRSPAQDALARALAANGIAADRSDDGALRVRNVDAAHIGHLAFTAGVELHELSTERFDLEELFFSLTSGAYAAPPADGPPPAGPWPPAGSSPPPGQYAPAPSGSPGQPPFSPAGSPPPGPGPHPGGSA
jgi:ABC-2 type transport system ATP-binding protein